tara:strand:- start:7769 stop:8053 length:285 start_codon:yes stop_codon:yes gene_type:complete
MNKYDAVLKYFIFKNIQDLGYLKYGYFKKIIGYVLDNYNEYFIRKLFLKLVTENNFYRKQNIKKSYLYKFNPNPKIKIPPKKVYNESYFIISWD